MRTCSITIPDEAALAHLAAALAAALPDHAFVALSGDLGAGKTTFVKAFAAAVGIPAEDVVSPTFGLVHEHASPAGMLLHADMYRLAGPDDLHEVGWQEAVARARWVFVEWPERIGAAVPAERLDLAITIDSPTARTFAFTGHGSAHEDAIDELASAVSVCRDQGPTAP